MMVLHTLMVQSNDYHYENPHSYAMTAWRSLQVSKLFDILQNTDWNFIKESIKKIREVN